jgi:protein TonB
MEPNQIKDADILDILFEGRNKDYGAYELRKTYNRRIRKAMFVTGGVVGLMCIGYFVAGRSTGKSVTPAAIEDIELANVKEPDKPLPLPPPPKAPPPVATIRVTTIRIVPDDQVKPDEKPPENVQVDDMKIGTANVKGAADDGIDAPPATGNAAGVVEAPKKKDDDDDGRFMPVEIEASFPGGSSAWLRFLNKNLQYSSDAQDRGIQGTVLVQFVVDKDGNVSDVQAISGPAEGGLKEEAVRVIRKSGKWTPGVQNGRYVKSYKRQPIIFQIASE